MNAAETTSVAYQEEPPFEKPPQSIVRWILGASLFLGIVGDILLRSLPLGLNGPLFVGSLTVCLIWGWNLHDEQSPCRSLLVIAFLLSLCLALRDAPVLRGLDIAALALVMIILCARPRYQDLHGDALSSLLANVLRGVRQAVMSPFLLLLQDTDWNGLLKSDTEHKAGIVARGLALLIPILLLFIWLFCMADAVFKHMVEKFIDNIADSCHRSSLHALWTLLFFLMAVLVLHPIFLGKKWKRIHIAPAKEWIPGQIELLMVMGPVLALFLLFITIQFRYLFGGHDLVQTVPGLTYATYARKGFFVLLLIVFLVHVILLLGTWLTAGTDRRVRSLYRGLGLGLVALTAFVFGSAYYRLYLYVDAYGLTQSRLYAAAVLVWLAAVFVFLAAKIALARWRCFTGAYIYSFLAVLLLINVANPDGLIARINLQRSAAGRTLDTAYLKGLSTDAVPAILRYSDGLPKNKRHSLASHIVTNQTPAADDWRTWNYSRAKAQKLLDR